MTGGKIEIDDKLDYLSFYDRYLERVVKSGDRITAKCPVCAGSSTTCFSADLKTGLYRCHKCDAKGNAFTFLEWSQGMTKEDARAAVKKLAGIVEMSSRDKTKPKGKITVAEYAADKRLPLDLLAELGVKDVRGNGHISIPYMDEAGIAVVTRKRMPKGASMRFLWVKGSAGKLIPYGVWKLREIEGKPLVIVEGESDAHALWTRGYENTIAIPGAVTLKPEWVKAYFHAAPEILLHVEPGDGGQKFLAKCCASLAAANYEGVVKAFSTRGAKDPSDLHVVEHDKGEADDFNTKWDLSLQGAQEIDPKDYAKATEANAALTLPGAPVALRIPEGFVVSAHGIKLMVEAKGEVGEVLVSPVPILISKRLRSIDTGEEKIELAYQRDGAWHSITTKRSQVFATRNIVELADRGLPITSETARYVVRYLGSLEACNLDTLPLVRSVERMGWVGARKFLPQLQGDIVLDPPDGSEHMADAYHEEGTMEAWKEQAAVIRDRFPLARFMLAGALAPTLLRDLRQRVFLIHLWGASRGGKTAAMKLALSCWGEPESLMATFNTTAVGLERMAGFYNDLPLGVDERQVVSGGRSGQGMIEGLVYLLGAGKGKIRGSKGGGLQATQAWRTIALTTGEEPLSSGTSHTGVKTRALEVFGLPIGDELAAQELHRTIGRNYGHAGPEFVRRYLAHLDAGGNLEADYESMATFVTALADDNMTSHVSAVAMVSLADFYLSRWIYGMSEEQARADALDNAAVILGGVETASETDYSGRAEEWIEQWIARHRERFFEHVEPYGFERNGTYWISPAVLEPFMEEAGFNPRRVLKDLAGRGRLHLDRGSTKPRLKVRQTWNSNRVWMVGYVPERDPIMQAELDCTPESEPVDPRGTESDPHSGQWWNRD